MSTVMVEMTREELQQIIEETVWQTLYQVLRDPDYGLVLHEQVIERLQADESLTEDELIPADQVAEELGLRW